MKEDNTWNSRSYTLAEIKELDSEMSKIENMRQACKLLEVLAEEIIKIKNQIDLVDVQAGAKSVLKFLKEKELLWKK